MSIVVVDEIIQGDGRGHHPRQRVRFCAAAILSTKASIWLCVLLCRSSCATNTQGKLLCFLIEASDAIKYCRRRRWCYAGTNWLFPQQEREGLRFLTAGIARYIELESIEPDI